MKFKITRRNGDFLNFNPRNEKHGQERVPASDITLRFTGGKRDFDILFPHPTMKLSDVIWIDKRMALAYVGLTNKRTPENVTFTVYDQATKRSSPLTFEGCKVKISDVRVKEKNTFECKVTVQLHDDPDEHSARLRALMDTQREFELEAQQEDFFGEDEEEEEKPKSKDDTQVDMIGDGEEEEDDTEDEEEEEDEEDED